jgi:Fe-S-cluster containining protein
MPTTPDETAMKNGKPFPIPVRAKTVHYSCNKCPAYCCTYSEIEISTYDIERLARHFGVDPETAAQRFSKTDAKGTTMLRHKKDSIFTSACMFLDQKERRCTVYHARPGVCRKFPDSSRCGYYEFLKFEREQQDDKEWIALT